MALNLCKITLDGTKTTPAFSFKKTSKTLHDLTKRQVKRIGPFFFSFEIQTVDSNLPL
jgi:hypothetical protein